MSHKQVTKEEFYNRINPLDAVIHLEGSYPYTSIYQLRDRREIGRITEEIVRGCGFPAKTYLLKV